VLAALDRGTIALIPARGGDLVDTGGVGHDVVMNLVSGAYGVAGLDGSQNRLVFGNGIG
jgi:hypothetical protein